MKKTFLGLLFSALLFGTLGMMFFIPRVDASGTIYIRPDGSVDPPSAPIERRGNIYAFLSDVYESIVIERDNIVVDGAGHTLRGNGSGIGISLPHRSNVTVTKTSIVSFYFGVWLNGSSGNTIAGNNITQNTNDGVSIDYSFWPPSPGSSHNTIMDNNITGNRDSGIYVEWPSNHNKISGNRIAANGGDGVRLVFSTSDTLSNNNITLNGYCGIWLVNAKNATLRGNTMTRNRFNFQIGGGVLEDYLNDIDTSNTVDGKPIYYWINKHNMTVPLDAGYVVLINSTDITATNLNLANNGGGLRLFQSRNLTIAENTLTNISAGAVHITNSSNISIRRNNLTNMYGDAVYVGASTTNITISHNTIANIDELSGGGIFISDVSGNSVTHNNLTRSAIDLSESSHNIVSHNRIKTDEGEAISLVSSAHDNTISNNTIHAGFQGIQLTFESYNNTVTHNNVSDAFEGISLEYSSNNNTLIGNNIINNTYAIAVTFSSANNNIYHNNFINNTYPLSTHSAGVNIWDNGYPSGGNYWSSHAATDQHRGPYQNETGSDGITDTPYLGDRYPLVSPYPSIHAVAATNLTPTKTIIGQGFTTKVQAQLANLGHFDEAVNVTLYANQTPITSQTISIKSEGSATLDFTWNTSVYAKGRYTLTVSAAQVPGELDPSDNTLNYTRQITVALIGDVSGPTADVPDGTVDIRDLAAMATLYGIRQADPRYNINLDLTGRVRGEPDGIIDIRDLATAARNYGKTDP